MDEFYFKYEGCTKDVNFNESYDSKHLPYGMKKQHIKFDDALKKQKELLKKNFKIDENTPKQKDAISNLENFYNFREKVLKFFRDYTEMVLMLVTKKSKDTPKITNSSYTSKSRQ